MTDLVDLIALKQAFASGHIKLRSNIDESTYCPSEPACVSCAFTKQCDRILPIGKQYERLITFPE